MKNEENLMQGKAVKTIGDPLPDASGALEGSGANQSQSLEAGAGVSNKQKLQELLGDILGEDYNPNDDELSSGKLFEYIKSGKERQGKLADALTEDPRLAQLLADVVGKKKNAHGALARYFGKDYLSAEEGTPEYDELMREEEERKKENDAAAASAKEYEDNLNESMPIVEEFCKEKGYEATEFLDKVWNLIVSPIFSGRYTPELCEVLDNGMNYSSDVQDAMKAGEVKGRNMNIARMKKEEGDGLPKNIGSSGNPNTKENKKAKTILNMAMEA